MSALPKVQVKEFTEDRVNQIFPKAGKMAGMVDRLNELANSDMLQESFRENLLSWKHVYEDGTYSLEQYASAVAFVSYLAMGYKQYKAWQLVFPERFARLRADGKDDQAISSYVAGYKRGKLVTELLRLITTPSYLYNMHYFQEALDTSVSIMRDEDVSPKVRADAAKTVLEYTKVPDDLGSNQEEVAAKGMSIIEELAKATAALAASQQQQIAAKVVNPKEVAGQMIYQGVVDD